MSRDPHSLGRCRGREHWAAKLRANKVRAMRRLAARGLCCTCIADLHGVKRQTAYDAIMGRTWSHIKPSLEELKHESS